MEEGSVVLEHCLFWGILIADGQVWVAMACVLGLLCFAECKFECMLLLLFDTRLTILSDGTLWCFHANDDILYINH